MAAIYSDQHSPLKTLLGIAGKSEDATLLIDIVYTIIATQEQQTQQFVYGGQAQ